MEGNVLHLEEVDISPARKRRSVNPRKTDHTALSKVIEEQSIPSITIFFKPEMVIYEFRNKLLMYKAKWRLGLNYLIRNFLIE